jgi:hypothetical protein
MALKRDYQVVQYADPQYWMSVAHTRGGIVSLSTTGSGLAFENQGTTASPKPLVAYVANSSGTNPVGLLLNDAVDIDETKYHASFHKDEFIVPGKPAIMRKGWVMTNNYVGSPTGGNPAYLSSSGAVTPTLHSTGGLVATPRIGTFLGSPSEDGYVKLEVNLPY